MHPVGSALLTFCLPLAGFAQAATEGPGPVLVKVNGVPISRAEAQDRAWKQYGTTVINEMADEILIRQAAERLKVTADSQQVEARLARIRQQFPDAATFNAQLAAGGSSLEQLRAQLQTQALRENLVIKAKRLSVSDGEAREFFNANKDRLGAPEAVHLRQLEVASEKEANDLLLAVRAGADFGKLAQHASLNAATKEKGGDLGLINRGVLLPEIEKLVFSLKAREAGGPVKIGLNQHLFFVESIRPAKAASYKEVEKDIKQALLAEKVTKTWPVYLKELRESAKYEPAAAQ